MVFINIVSKIAIKYYLPNCLNRTFLKCGSSHFIRVCIKTIKLMFSFSHRLYLRIEYNDRKNYLVRLCNVWVPLLL